MKRSWDPSSAQMGPSTTVSGTAEELDRELPVTLVNFVSAHLELKNTLDRAKAEMDAAAKTAQAEARSKSKTSVTKVAPKPEPTKAAETTKPMLQTPPEPPKSASLFDAPAQANPAADQDEEEEILAETAEPEQGDEELDDAA